MSDESTEYDQQGLPTGVIDSWEAVVSDMEATAAEYREDGWTVIELHPGDVATLTGNHERIDRYGLDLVVPSDEAETVYELVEAEDAAFDSCSLFKAVRAGIVFLVVAVEDETRGIAVLYPAYYDVDDEQTEEMLEVATSRGEMQTHVRNLGGERLSTFTHGDPSLFFPTDD